MCGFAGYGFLAEEETADALLKTMGQQIVHRGPDAVGAWHDDGLRLGLVHRRLSIQDLSPAGAQPMVSRSGRFVIAFNGEAYNFRHLRKELESFGHAFLGHSDTEVMLAAFEQWGIHGALEKFVGMFAFALVDRQYRRLYLARDRMGEKPLYYGWQNGVLLFGSELKALRVHPAWEGKVDASVLPLLLRHNVIPAPHSIYQDVRKLLPATYVCFDLDRPQTNEWPEPLHYWHLEQHIETREVWDRALASRRLEAMLDDSIEGQMISDVPLGAFLSGGIDSSTVVALMQKQATQPVRTFSIGFDEPGFNEAEHARQVADYLGTNHTELYVTPKDALDIIPQLPKMYDEPFADSSQIPTHLVSRMTREHVTVALSGDGGDELFCGYTRYPATVNGWQQRGGAKARLRRLLASLPKDYTAPGIRALVPSQRHRSIPGVQHKLNRERYLSRADSLSEYYRRKVSFWAEPERALVNAAEPPYALTAPLPEPLQGDPLKALMWRDAHWYLPDDILTKVDRAAMACSLETRIPLLDHRIVEFAFQLPTALNMQGNVGKQVLRDVLFRHVPRELVERPKQGFAIPIGAWLRRDLRDWAESLLDPVRLHQQGYWHTENVRWFWQEHLSGREDFSFELWGILMFQAWLDENEA